MKWQDILKYTGVGGTISVFLLIGLILNLSGMSYTFDGDKFCVENCYSEIRVNSTYWEIKVEHAGDKDVIFKKTTRSRTLWLNLDKIDEFVTTDPNIKTELLVGAINRTSTEYNEEYGFLRPLKDGDTLIHRNTKSKTSPSRIIIHGNKSAELDVKWSFILNDPLMKKIDIDPVWKGINEKNIFPVLLYNKADLTHGEAIFEIENPFNKSISLDDLNFNFKQLKGSKIKDFEVLVNYSESYQSPIHGEFTEIKTCKELDNVTNISSNYDCSELISDVIGYETKYKESWKESDILPGKSKIKLTANWDAQIGKQSLDWIPTLNLEKTKFGLTDDITLTKNKWAWWNSSWDSKISITIDSNKVEDNLTDFPIYLDMSDFPQFFFDNVTSTGGDIRILNDDETIELPREIVNLTTGSNIGEIHFKANLSTIENTTFYIYYNNSDATNYPVSGTYGAQNVWDKNYTGVFHIKTGDTIFNDSTSKGNDGTFVNNAGVNNAQSQVGGSALELDGTTDYATFPNDVLHNKSVGTLSFWGRPEVLGPGFRYIVGASAHGGDELFYRVLGDGSVLSAVQNSYAFNNLPAGSWATGNWYYTANTWNRTHTLMYFNNTLVEANPFIAGSPNNNSGARAGDSWIGDAWDGEDWDGQIDEFRGSDINRSGEWMATEYNNQFSPSTFYTIGEEEYETFLFPNITLNSPQNRFNSSSQDMIFNITGWDETNLTNVSLYGNWSGGWHLNETNTSGINDTFYIFPKTIADGYYLWAASGTDNDSQTTFTENQTFLIDSIFPLVDYVAPTEINEENKSQTWIFVNVSLTETNFKNITFGLYWDNLTIVNITTRTTESLYQINWTDLPNGKFTYNVSVMDLSGNENVTSNRNITLDTNNPLIEFVSPTLANDSLADSTWIYANVSLIELNFQNITFNLYNSTGFLINQTFRTTKGLEINWTELAGDNYYYNAETFDVFSLYNSTGNRTISLTTFSMFFEGIEGNNTAELGGPYNLIANSTANVTICVDIDHPAFGDNYSCGYGLDFNFTLNYFRNTSFSDLTTSQIHNFTDNETFFNLTFNSHQYDEADNLSINISGVGSPEDLTFYNANSTPNLLNASNYKALIDRFFHGTLLGPNIYTHEFFDGVNETNLSYSTAGKKIIYVLIDDILSLKSDYTFFLNFSGYEFGFEFEELFPDFDLIDESLTTGQLNLGLFIGSANATKQEFVHDDFEDSSFDTDMWEKTADFVDSSGDCTRTRTTTEADGKLTLLSQTTHGGSGSVNCGAGTTSVFGNRSWINLEASEDVSLNISFSYTGVEDNALCNGYGQMIFGGFAEWTSMIRTGDGGVETSKSDLIIDFKKFNTTHWEMNITGYESFSTISFTHWKNWTSGQASAGALTNPSYDPLIYFQPIPLQFDAYADAASTQCDSASSSLNVHWVNKTLYNRSNGTIISDSVFDSSSNIITATLGQVGLKPNDELIFGYLSADDGVTWDSVTFDGENSFSEPGKHIKYKIEINMTNPGYKNFTTFITEINISTEQGNVSDLFIDVGDDGVIDSIISQELNDTNRNTQVNLSYIDLSSFFNANNAYSVINGTITYPHTYKIPVSINSSTKGLLVLNGVNFTYDPNPILFNKTKIQETLDDSTNKTIFRIPFSSFNSTTSSANVTINDVRYDYAGGNKTILFTLHDALYQLNKTFSILYHYSRWDFSFVPQFVNYLEFIPNSPTSVDVSPFGQDNNTAILNITNYLYDGNVADLSVYLNGTFGCISMNISTDNNISNSNEINESWLTLKQDSIYLEPVNIWMWANYSCSGWSNFTLFNPDLYFRQCVDGGLCSTSLT